MGLPKLTEYMNVIIIVKTFRSAKLRKKSFLELHFGNNIAYNKTPTHTHAHERIILSHFTYSPCNVTIIAVFCAHILDEIIAYSTRIIFENKNRAHVCFPTNFKSK